MLDIVTTTWIVWRLEVVTQVQINLEQRDSWIFFGLTTKIHLIAVILDETEEAKMQAIVSQ